MSYDKEIIKYAMTRILTDKRYSEQGEKWARFYLLKAFQDFLVYINLFWNGPDSQSYKAN